MESELRFSSLAAKWTNYLPPSKEDASTYGPEQQQSEERALRTAKALATKYVGVIVWTRQASPALSEYGDPVTLFPSGEVPDM